MVPARWEESFSNGAHTYNYYEGAMKTAAHVLVCVSFVLLFAGCTSGSGNRPPAADAGPDQASGVLVGDAVVLDASNSSDPDGDALTYVWTLTTVPTDSTAVLSDPFSDKPTFIADKTGTYVAQLVVNDGSAESAADDTSVTAVVPAPTVTITTPETDTIALTSPVAVTGTVDDPAAAITVDGVATPNNNGSYDTKTELVEGGNTVTVVATNSTGADTASVHVFLKALVPPVISITSPEPNFSEGVTWNGVGAIEIPVQVSGIISTVNTGGIPTVDVNGINASVTSLGCPPGHVCVWSTVAARYRFMATIQLSKGPRTITATGTDASGGTAVATVSGVADYCLIDAAVPGVAAERGIGQNNRCHFVDGCSAPGSGDNSPSDARRNQPMPNANQNLVLVEFGSGTIPPSEFFIHGKHPQRLLGCNVHDGCYQTCVPPGGGDRAAAYDACNHEQLENHKAMCRQAYPATCPYAGQPFRCLDWEVEKKNCFGLAKGYFATVEAGGFLRYNARQNDFCLN